MPIIDQPNLTRAQGEAHKLIQSLAIRNPSEIELNVIAMTRGVLVVEDDLEGADARLLRKGDRGIIRVSNKIPEAGRKRFAIAHELGHWELHKELSQLAICLSGDIQGYSESPAELEASKFASELLMPTMLARPIVESSEPDLKLVKLLAETFDVSFTAALVRLVELTEEACFAIFSENNQVSWWKKSSKAEELWIERNQEIDSESLAWECAARKPVPSERQIVPSRAWFSERLQSRISEVYEQSLLFERYSTVGTLLWVHLRDLGAEDEDD